MRVAYAFLAEAAEFNAAARLNCLGGDLEVVEASAFPATHIILCVVVKFIFPVSESGHSKLARLSIVYPDGTVVPTRAEIRIVCADALGYEPHVGVVFEVTKIPFPTPGEYNFRIDLDGTEATRIPLIVRQRGQQFS